MMNKVQKHRAACPARKIDRDTANETERDACGVGLVANPQGGARHDIIVEALSGLICMEHRGACSADNDSGDGAGLMTAIPWELLQAWFAREQLEMLAKERLAVGMMFLPQDPALATKSRQAISEIITLEGLQVLGWRVVPTQPELLGVQARENEPQIEQVVVSSPNCKGEDLERLLYIIMKRISNQSPDCYVCSFSSRQIVYKGMVRSAVLGEFYLDLKNPAYKSPYAIFHRRFSTNTMPRWPLAQPLRMLGHNGEINTLLGNINWMKSRQGDLDSDVWGSRLEELLPIVNKAQSDSANLDNVMELLVLSGRSPTEAMMMLVPEAYKNQPELADRQEIVDFYEYYSGMQEPWDGPALIVFSDGHTVGAMLDRNGLRPARYCMTRNGYLLVCSEAGAIPLPSADIVEKGRLGPGQMIAVDLESHEVLKNWEIKQRVAGKQPYGEWLKRYRQALPPQAFVSGTQMETADLLRQQMAFGYTSEDVEMVIQAMAQAGKEPTFCMGDDIPLAILSSKPHVLYNYFKQRFAQVTNPPIDPLREGLVMSLHMLLGFRGNLLAEKPEFARHLELETPVLNEAELEGLLNGSYCVGNGSAPDVFKVATLSTLWNPQAGPDGLATAVDKLCQEAAQAVREGAEILVLSDRFDGRENAKAFTTNPENALAFTTNPENAKAFTTNLTNLMTYIPPLLAVGAVHNYLNREGLRCRASIIIDTAQCWSTHHFACLIGYGASAVCPYLALETVRHWWSDSKTQSMMQRGKIPAMSMSEAQQNYRKAICAGLLKIISKKGISLLSSYHGSQIFEAIGLGQDLLALGFTGTTSRLRGLSVRELAEEVMAFHKRAFPELTVKKLENFGFVQYRVGLEYHMNSPEMAKALHKAVTGSEYDHYEVYKRHLAERPVTALRDLLDLKGDRTSIPIEEVEPVEDIVKRFCTGGMSLGSLSREAHETLAIAMNRMGGKSNSGEGGEDPLRFKVLDDVDVTGKGLSATLPHLQGLRNGDTASSAIKQVASGRFGVTPEYLMHGKQLEIKIAQGAKPGEGGQLPGKKVSPYIASLRRSKPGVPLISPPPHHDIYSIEDLAQLIFDLHQINPQAKVSVKLVAQIGIGTVAAGVAKANADVIQISGHDGGTGASPLSSIKHAGTPWELGVTEVHRTLMQNGLRDRVLIRTDGGLKTGWDVIMAALMGAEEYGFGSIAMIAEGCIMARICHTNNCPVGVATQQEKLRKRFTGMPEHVVNFFYFVAQEVRQLLARLGYRSLTEIIGRADLLQAREGVQLTKTSALNLNCLLELPDSRSDRSWLHHEDVRGNGPVLDDQLLADGDIQKAISDQGSATKQLPIVSTDRCVGARLAGAIAKQYGNNGFEGEINLNFTGSAGQSFGAFNLPGMKLFLEGEANDYVGKGMHGGEIVIKPPADAPYNPGENVIVGNTCLYGATGGVLFANGTAGERFAVRNSMGKAVIEGAGDHTCEYMTGGVVVVLGKVGRNVAAGMTGGMGYFLDEDGSFPEKVNMEIVKIQRVSAPVGERQLQELIEIHRDRTGSEKAKMILENWEKFLPLFWQVVPPSEADSPEATAEAVTEKVAVKA